MMFFPRNQYVKVQWWMRRFGQRGEAVPVGETEARGTPVRGTQMISKANNYDKHVILLH